MKQILLRFIGAACLLCLTSLSANPVITFFFREYPVDSACALDLSNDFKNPDCIAKQTINGVTQYRGVAGIVSTYFGYLQVSNGKGQTTFPRKSSRPLINVIITNKITPIMMFQNTISHWEIEPGTPAALYTFEFKEDSDTKLTFWEVNQGQLPEKNQVNPINSIIIIAKPNNIFIPSGITVTPRDANMILPDMYVKPGIKTTNSALYMLNMNHFFRPVEMLYEKKPKTLDSLVQEY